MLLVKQLSLFTPLTAGPFALWGCSLNLLEIYSRGVFLTKLQKSEFCIAQPLAHPSLGPLSIDWGFLLQSKVLGVPSPNCFTFLFVVLGLMHAGQVLYH
jgi:hypothetical protein